MALKPRSRSSQGSDEPPGQTEIRTFPEGAIIFSKGDPGDVMYIVQDGTVEILIDDRVINTLGPGSILGEMALVNHQPRSATARAKFDCELKAMDEERFLAEVQSNPHFALELVRTLSSRLRRQTAS